MYVRGCLSRISLQQSVQLCQRLPGREGTQPDTPSQRLCPLLLLPVPAVYRSWLRDQVGKDPELAAHWQQWEAQVCVCPCPALPWSAGQMARRAGICLGSRAAAVQQAAVAAAKT